MDMSTFIFRGFMRGAHGQPDGIAYAVEPDGRVLFNDVPRHIYGECDKPLNLEAIREEASDDADWAREVEHGISWKGFYDKAFSRIMKEACENRIKDAYVQPPWNGSYIESAYTHSTKASYLGSK